jgi:hypothetical protein
MTKKKNLHWGTTLDTFLSEDGIPKALKVLKRAGVGKPPIKGDEQPPRKKRAKRQAA